MTPALQRAIDLFNDGRLHEARLAVAKLLRVRGDSLPALQLMGAVLCELQSYDSAVAHLKRAVALDPGSASAHFNLGKAQQFAGRQKEALESLARALRLDPDRAETYLAYGNALSRLRRQDEALANYQRALALNPDLADAHFHVGRILSKTDHAKAAAAFDEMLKHEPGAADGWLWKAFCQQELCDWTDYDARTQAVTETVRSASQIENFTFALFLATVCDDNSVLRVAADMELARADDPGVPAFVPTSRGSGRTRIAYISGDFRNHAVARLVVGLIEAHDRQKFEVIGLSIGPNDASPMRKRLEAAFDHFEDLEASSLRQLAERVRTLDVDIAVDLLGHTDKARPGVYVSRVAPVQVNFLGFPGTMGGSAFDYMIVDPFIATDDLRRNAAEKLVILPDCYQANDDKRQIAQTRPSRVEEGLPDGAFVFCCFNLARKITPQAFDAWMRILRGVDGSVLWLLGSTDTCMANLRAEAARRGVKPERLVFAKRRPLEQHLARITLADLSLDTFPYTAHTTGSDALWAGCPIMTLAGNSFASRVCASLLHAVGLPELVTYSWADYEVLALRLAGQPDELGAIRKRLAASRLTTPLFDTRRFARNIERAYAEMVRRNRSDEPASEIDVRALA
jgi:protein O-GlcNAc transferase